jgi:hypothetical protein
MAERWSASLAERMADSEHRRRFLESHRQGAILLSRAVADPETRDRPVSRLGGRPNLPAHQDWPRDEDGPLRFLAQLDLDALGDVLPLESEHAKGLLLFFYNDCPFHASTPGRALHVARADIAAALPREAPDDIRPIADLPTWRVDKHLAGNRRWARWTRRLPCWLLQGRAIADFPDEPSDFGWWPDDLRQTYWEDYARKREEHVTAQLGAPAVWKAPAPEQLVRFDEHVPERREPFSEGWPPGGGWPYAWIQATAFAGELNLSIEGEFAWASDRALRDRQNPRYESLRALMDERATRVEKDREHLTREARDAAAWVRASQDHDPFAALTPDEAAAFRAWAAGLSARRAAVGSLNSTVQETTDLMLGYAPESVVSRMPPGLVELFMRRHAPLRRDAYPHAPVALIRHQVLGPPKLVQAEEPGGVLPQRLLAQFDSDSSAALGLGDAGVLHFWVPEEDWAKGRFDRVRAVEASH